MSTRNIKDLYEPFKNVCEEALEIAKDKELRILIICVLRSSVEQFLLWCQGRRRLEEVNKLRKEYGMVDLKDSENRVVTWTKESFHSTVPKSMAFDFCCLKEDGKIEWEVLKANVNKNEISDYKEFAEICKSLDTNIEWGGDWSLKKKDYSHIQWKNGLNIIQ